MACTDGGVPYPESREETLNRLAPAMLCGLVQAARTLHRLDDLLDQVNWTQAGVTCDEFVEWLKLHDARDHERRLQLSKKMSEADLKRRALAKLTLNERKALGL
jgi:hypothetical protein